MQIMLGNYGSMIASISLTLAVFLQFNPAPPSFAGEATAQCRQDLKPLLQIKENLGQNGGMWALYERRALHNYAGLQFSFTALGEMLQLLFGRQIVGCSPSLDHSHADTK